MRLALGLVALALVACAEQCTPVPTPPPGPNTGSGGVAPLPPTGGAAGVGGQSSTAQDRCIVDLTSDPETANVARRAHLSVTSLVGKLCTDPGVLGYYR